MVLASAALAAAIAACESPAATAIEGLGTGESVTFDLVAGVYAVRWVAQDPGTTDHGCHFGLALEGVDVVEVDVGGIGRNPQAGNVVYRGVPAGTTLTGSTRPMSIATGTYRLRSSGSCAWEAQIVPGDPDALPTPDNGFEQMLDQHEVGSID